MRFQVNMSYIGMCLEEILYDTQDSALFSFM